MTIRALVPALLCLLAFPALSRAQEGGQVGLTMGFPAAAGFIWHATDRLAVRPEIAFSQITSETEASLPNASVTTTQRSVGVGAALLWYFGSSGDNVRAYISPRVVYTHATSEDSRTILDDDEDKPARTLTVSGALGVQSTPSRRFGLFGEVGLARGHREQTSSFPSITITASVTTWSIRSAVGVILYFGS